MFGKMIAFGMQIRITFLAHQYDIGAKVKFSYA